MDGRRGLNVLEWRPRIKNRNVRQPTRWTGDLVRDKCEPLQTEANMGEACVQTMIKKLRSETAMLPLHHFVSQLTELFFKK